MQIPDPQARARLDVLVARTDGSDVKKLSFVMEVRHTGDARKLGEHAGQEMRKILPESFLAA
jgi:hypothetical protein